MKIHHAFGLVIALGSLSISLAPAAQTEARQDEAARQSDNVMQDTGDAVLVIYAGKFKNAGEFQIQKINNEGTGFIGKPKTVRFGSLKDTNLGKSAAQIKSLMGLKVDSRDNTALSENIPAGKYAVIYKSWTIFGRAYSECLSDGAVTFDVLPGKVNMVSWYDIFPRLMAQDTFEETTYQQAVDHLQTLRLEQAELGGPVIEVKPAHEARWTVVKRAFGQSCASIETDSLYISRIGGQASQSGPDETEQAAILAAMENLKNANGNH